MDQGEVARVRREQKTMLTRAHVQLLGRCPKGGMVLTEARVTRPHLAMRFWCTYATTVASASHDPPAPLASSPGLSALDLYCTDAEGDSLSCRTIVASVVSRSDPRSSMVHCWPGA